MPPPVPAREASGPRRRSANCRLPRFVKRSPKCLRIALPRAAGSEVAIKSLSSDLFRPLSRSLLHKSQRARLTRRSTWARGATINRRGDAPRPRRRCPCPRGPSRRGAEAARRGSAGGSGGQWRGPQTPPLPGLARKPAWLPAAALPWCLGHASHLAPRSRGRSAASHLPGEDAGGGACHPQGPARAGGPGSPLLLSQRELQALSSLYVPASQEKELELRDSRPRARFINSDPCGLVSIISHNSGEAP